MSNSLSALLLRIQAKIESRTRRPWFDLQRTYYYRDQHAIKTPQELKSALEHFHVLLTDYELSTLLTAFPTHDGNFDFKSFALALYPKGDSEIRPIKDGRFTDSKPLYETSDAVAYAPQPIQTQTLSARTQPSNIYMTEYIAANTQPINYDTTIERDTMYGEEVKVKKTARRTQKFKPVLTYNRPHHARFHETGSAIVSAAPIPTRYPSQEFDGHGRYPSTREQPRFEIKAEKPWVEVERRHNISRQYHRQ